MTHPQRIPRSNFADYRKLLQKKYRRLEGRFLIEGVHLVQEALASDWKCEALLLSDGFMSKDDYPDIARKAASKKVTVYAIPDRDLERLSDMVTSQGIVGIVGQKNSGASNPLQGAGARSLIVALEGVADPGNLGTIIRTCDWFGTDALLLSEDTVELYNPKVIRATMGSLFHLPIVPEVDLRLSLVEAKENGFTILAAALDGESILNFNTSSDRVIVIFGNEARGIHPDIQRLATATVSIPRYGRAESLNVAVSCAAVLTALRLRKES